MSKINARPGHLRNSSGKLNEFGGKLAEGGQKLEIAGQNLVSHAGNDKSGVGAVVAKAMGKGVEITGKVFNEGGRVAEGAGKRLGVTADLYEEADDKGAGLFKRLHPDSKDVGPKGHGSSSASRERATHPGKGHHTTAGSQTSPGHSIGTKGTHADEQRRLREQYGEPKPDSDWLADADDVKHRRHPGLKPGDPTFDAVTKGRQPPTGTDLDRFNSKWSHGRDPNSGFENYQYPTEEYGHPNGFASPQDKHAEWVPPGTRVDRFGSEYGSFLATEGAPWPERALPPHTLNAPYHTYEVTQPFPSWVGPAAAWFDQPGGATQYFLGQYDVDRLLKAGYLRETTGE